MHSPSLELVNDCHIYISGEVIVHPSAAIAPGVLLQADPGCRVTIAAGACIGQGTIVHAHQGTIAIEAGAILGSGVLLIGHGSIGVNACVGALTTIIDGSVAPDQLVPAHSLIGDASRQLTVEPAPEPAPAPASPAPNASTGTAPDKPPKPEADASKQSPPKSSSLASKALTQVYGQTYVERIMITMFPHRQSLNDSPSEPSPDPPP